MKKIIIGFVAILIVLTLVFVIVIVKNNITNVGENIVSEEVNQENKRPDWLKTIDTNNINNIITNIFSDKTQWNNDMYPISKKFKNKYKTWSDIKEEFINANSILSKTDNIDKHVFTLLYNNIKYYYEYFINDLGELDDLKYIRQVEYAEFSGENGTTVLERKDGKIEARPNEVELLLRYIACPKPNYVAYDEFEFYSEERMPYSDKCKIIGRPTPKEIGEPSHVYFGGEHPMTGERKYENDKSPEGNPYLTFDYNDYIKVYEVKYKVNDEYFFDYIEYKEVTDEIK